MNRLLNVPNLCAVVAAWLLVSAPLFGQAFLPGKGSGTVSVDFGTTHSAGHFMDDGSKLPGYGTRAYSLSFSVDYGLTDRLALGFSIPYVNSKYTGKEEPLNLPNNVVDDGVYHGTMQDIRLEARYNILERPFVATPFFAFSVPSHSYPTIGEAAVGPNLKQYSTGIYVGRLLNPFLSRAFVHGAYTFTAVEKVLDLSLNRSNTDVSFGYFLTPRVSTTFLWTGQWSHGGLGFSDIYNTTSSEIFLQQDRLTKQSYQHIGVGVGLNLTESLSASFSFRKFVSGVNAHYGEGISGGLSWSFSTAPQFFQ
jgi:hypothetical protein